MRVIDAISQILLKEGIEYLSAFPTTSVIEAAAEAGIKPVICRQERVGVGIADGYARIKAGNPPGVFAMQYGPGAENAYPGVATAYADASPVLFLPLGHPLNKDRIFPHFSSVESFSSITKYVEQINHPEKTCDTMRRAFYNLKSGRPGPVMVEIPSDIANQEVRDDLTASYIPSQRIISKANDEDILRAAKLLLQSQNPLIYAGQGIIYSGATEELTELAEVTNIPVTTTMAGKGSIDERHPLALGSSSIVMNGAVRHYMLNSDTILAIGTSLTKHGMITTIPDGKKIIHAVNDTKDIGNYYDPEIGLLGDGKLVLQQLILACKDLISSTDTRISPEEEIKDLKTDWLKKWHSKLTSRETPMTPYRVIWEFMNIVDPSQAIVTHDSGSPRDQIMPFYISGGPGTYIGWGKSHGLGTGLGLNIGAKLAAPEKFVVNFMGDAAFGMTGLDFETAVRSNIPILTVVLNNSTMAIETSHMAASHEMYNTRDLGGDYSEMAKAMGGWSEKVSDPNGIKDAFKRAKEATENGETALLEFITSEEQDFSYRGPVI
jgi:acetolactate synthase-1/2/3 large subunit